MNVQLKRFLCGVAVCGAIAGQAQAQDNYETGSVRLDDPTPDSVSGGLSPVAEPGVVQFSPPAAAGVAPLYGFAPVDAVFQPRFRVDARGGQLYGYDEGYTNVGGFMPVYLDPDSLIFADVRAMITNQGKGGANAGLGWRRYDPMADMVYGLSAWYDYDNGHRADFSQFGLSAELLSRYWELRGNGYIPIGRDTDIVDSRISGFGGFQQNNLILNRANTVNTAFSGFDVEVGGPMPLLGRYGLNGYVGFYFFDGNDAGDFTGVSGRLNAQINSDLSIGATVTDDHTFGTNAQIQVVATLPNGAPTGWLRPLRMRDKLAQPVQRNYRAIVKEEVRTVQELAIDPRDNLPFFVAHIDPDLGDGGDGTIENPFNQLSDFDTLAPADKQRFDIVYVQPRADGTSTNLDTGVTILSQQRLLSSSVDHLITAVQGPITLTRIPGDANPILRNVGGGDVVTLVTGGTDMEVAGFDIRGSATGNGIRGDLVSNISVNQNRISEGVNGVYLTNLSGTLAAGTETTIFANTFLNNSNDGLAVVNNGAAELNLYVDGNTATGNGNNGMEIAANAGSIIRARIASNTTALIGTATPNGNNGILLSANNGTIDVGDPANGFYVGDNNLSQNGDDGLDVTVAGPAGVAGVFAVRNIFNANGANGLHFQADGGLGFIQVGSLDPADANTFTNQANGSGLLIEGRGFSNTTGAVFNNTFNNNLAGITLSRDGAATLNVAIAGNTINGNTDGIVFQSSGLGGGVANFFSSDNTYTGNFNGLTVRSSGNSSLSFQSDRDTVTGNTGNGVFVNSTDTSTLGAVFNNLTAINNAGNGLGSLSSDNSTLFLNVQSPGDAAFTPTTAPTASAIVGNETTVLNPNTGSNFTGNQQNGINITAEENSRTVATFNNVDASLNTLNGLNVNRFDASLVQVAVDNSRFNRNQNGLQYNYGGSDPSNPNQPLFGQPNTLSIANSTFSENTIHGLSTVGSNNGILLAGVSLSRFTNNGVNGVDILTNEQSGFGVPLATTRSVFDGITATGNGTDGIWFTANDDVGVGSAIYAEINSDSGNSLFADNGFDGIHVQAGTPTALSGAATADVLIQGDTNGLGPNFSTTISRNGSNGIYIQASGASAIGSLPLPLPDTVTVTVLDATIGGPNAADGNGTDGAFGNDGIVMLLDGFSEGNLTVGTPGRSVLIQNNLGDGIDVFAADASTGTVTISNTEIADNGANGLYLRTQGFEGKNFVPASLIVDVQQSIIRDSGLDGVNIELYGSNSNSFNFDSNLIESNGRNGVLFQANAGNSGFYQLNINLPQPTTPATPFDPDLVAQAFPFIMNTSENLPFDAFSPAGTTYSDYLNVDAENRSTFTFTRNTVRFNGTSGIGGDGLFMRVSTDSYVAADIGGANGSGLGNTFTGNRLSDFRTESFRKTTTNSIDATTGIFNGTEVNKRTVAPSDDNAAPALDVIFLDDTAQLDLQFYNNSGNSINPGTAFAVEEYEFLLDFPDSAIDPDRFVQLFQVNGSAADINASNNFQLFGVPQNEAGLFNFQGLFHIRNAEGVFPDPNFPYPYLLQPGNPFSP